MKKILIGGVTNAAPEVLEAHLQTALWQDAEVEADFLYVVDGEMPEDSFGVFDEAGIETRPAGPKPSDAQHVISDDTHHWSKSSFSWLARERQRLLNHVVDAGYDAILLVDSDLLLSPGTLRSLIQTEKKIVSAVFWTKWQRDAPPLPNAWLRHPYELQGKGLEANEFIESLAHRELVEVGGLGACTLIRREAIEKGVAYAPLLEGLPEGGMWEGEDRSFSIRAQRLHIPLYADAWPDLFHVYRPSDVERIPEMMERLKHRSSLSPRNGDLVSAILEPAEESRLLGWRLPLRGRLGEMKILPAIESTLKRMKRGDERFVRVRFPMWWPAKALAGEDRAVRIRLLDVKPFSVPPTLEEFERPVEFLTDTFHERLVV